MSIVMNTYFAGVWLMFMVVFHCGQTEIISIDSFRRFIIMEKYRGYGRNGPENGDGKR